MILFQLLAAFLLAILPPCPTEDSYWCGWDDGDGVPYVNLWERDPGPISITLDGRLDAP